MWLLSRNSLLRFLEIIRIVVLVLCKVISVWWISVVVLMFMFQVGCVVISRFGVWRILWLRMNFCRLLLERLWVGVLVFGVFMVKWWMIFLVSVSILCCWINLCFIRFCWKVVSSVLFVRFIFGIVLCFSCLVGMKVWLVWCCVFGVRCVLVQLLRWMCLVWVCGRCILLLSRVSNLFWLLLVILVILRILLLCIFRLRLVKDMLKGFGLCQCRLCIWRKGVLLVVFGYFVVRFLVLFIISCVSLRLEYCVGMYCLVICLLCSIVVCWQSVWILVSLWLMKRILQFFFVRWCRVMKRFLVLCGVSIEVGLLRISRWMFCIRQCMIFICWCLLMDSLWISW